MQAHLQPHRYAETAWLRESYVPQMPEVLTTCVPRNLPTETTLRLGQRLAEGGEVVDRLTA